MPDAMWESIRVLLPVYRTEPFGRRPRKDLRSVADAIYYTLRTGCQWKAIPVCLASGSTAHAYFQEWVKRGVFADLWEIALELYDDLVGLDWRWQSIDGTMTKVPLEGKSTGKNPTDRGKTGTKRSLLPDAAGIPTGLAVGGATVHDIRLLRSTLSDAQMRIRGINSGVKEHLCMAKGYDSVAASVMVQNLFEYIPYVRARGEEKKSIRMSLSAYKGPVMGASKGANSTGKAWGILIGGFFGVLLLEFAHGTSARYAKNPGKPAFI